MNSIVPKFELFGTKSCPYTQEMREWLEWKGHDYVEYDVDMDREARARSRVGTLDIAGSGESGRRPEQFHTRDADRRPQAHAAAAISRASISPWAARFQAPGESSGHGR